MFTISLGYEFYVANNVSIEIDFNSKMYRSTYFVKKEMFLQKFSWSEVITGEFFLNYQKEDWLWKKRTSGQTISEYPLKMFV